MAFAGVQNAYVVLGARKWDIPQYLAVRNFGLNIAYLVTGDTGGPPFTLDVAYPFVRDSIVVSGFPDIIFQPEDSFTLVLERQAQTGADAALGILPANDPETADLVAVSEDGMLQGVQLHPGSTDLRRTWILAAWNPSFTDFMHLYLRSPAVAASQNLSMTSVIGAAVDEGLNIQCVELPGGRYVDIGTPDAWASPPSFLKRL